MTIVLLGISEQVQIVRGALSSKPSRTTGTVRKDVGRERSGLIGSGRSRRISVGGTLRRVGRVWRTGGRVPAPGAAVEDAPVVGVPVPPAGGLAAAGAAGPTSREALSPSPRLCVPATTRYTVPAALAAPSAAC